MKKKIALLLSALMIMGALAACGAKSGMQAQPEAAAETWESAEGVYSADGSVIYDKDGVTVTTAGLDADPTTEDVAPIIWVDIENTGAQDVCLGVTGGSVNGVVSEVRLIDFYMENGKYYGGDYASQLVIPAGGGRYALGYYGSGVPGIDLSTLGELEFCFTTAEDEFSVPDYISDPVKIVTGETVPTVDITALGTVAVDNDAMTLVVGEQDYDDWFGPTVCVYMLNRTDRYIAISADSAELDGVQCDYLLGGLAAAPGKAAAAVLSFDGEAKELKGFENLTLNLSCCEGENMESMNLEESTPLDPITVQYPPQIWGEYESGGISMEIQPKYNDLITVETDSADGMLYTVSETASVEAGGFEGAGWLFSIGAVNERTLHEMLGSDMSGADVFAKGEDGSYYVYYHPTDVRYARATTEEMERDSEQWTMLCEWAESMKDKITGQNGLESAAYGNSAVDIYVARAAYHSDVNYTLSTTEFGPVDGTGVDGAAYADFILRGFFTETEDEAPDGEYVVLTLPDEDVRIDFFFAPDAYARVIAGGQETMYQAAWWDDNISYAEAMQGWYYAAAEQAGVKQADNSLNPFCGAWAEKIAGRGYIEIEKSIAPDKVRITASWPDSAALMNEWEIVAALEDGKLVYENAHWTLTGYDESGEGQIMDESYEESGCFYFNDAGELCWHDGRAERSEDSAFISAG